MTREEAIKMVKAKLECMTRDVSGRDDDCNNRRCDECPLNYKQGNMGEQKEWLKMAVEALQQQLSERTEERTETHACDCISRKAVLDALHSYFAEGFNEDRWWNSTHVLDAINKVPSIAPQPKAEQESFEDCIRRSDIGLTNLEILMCNGDYKEALKMLLDKIKNAPSVTPQPKAEPQPKTGRWIEHKGTFKPHIECSKCLIWFLREDLPRNSYCPNCGSRNHWEWELKLNGGKKK